MAKCDFNEAALQLIEIGLRHACSPVNFLHIFRTSFRKSILEVRLPTDTVRNVNYGCIF